MDRRGFIALLAPLTAGCFGGTAVSRRGEETPTATPANETATPEPTATATPEPTATATPEPTATADQRRAARRLRTARERVRGAVEAYAGAGSVADVRADSDRFVARDVYVRLVEASGAVNEAQGLAVTEEQTATAAALEGVVAFLSEATAGQAAAIAGHDALVEARAELEADDVGSARSAVDALSRHRSDVERAVSRVERVSDRSDLEASEAVDVDARASKLEQFRAAATALDESARPARTLADAVELLRDAREAVDDGDPDTAVDLAEEAEGALSDVADTLDRTRDDLPAGAKPFRDAVERLGDLATSKADAANDIIAEHGGS